jgi:hypothetical protein
MVSWMAWCRHVWVLGWMLPLAALASPLPAEPGKGAAGHWDLCDLGRVPWPAASSAKPADVSPVPPEHLLLEALSQWSPRVDAALAAAGPRAQAAVALMDGRRVPLALLASSHEPAVAMWAAAACRDDTACRQAAARRWQQIEPDNLMAWLADIGSQSALAPATVHKLARSTRAELHFGALPATLARAWPSEAPRHLLSPVLVAAIGTEAAFSTPPMHPLVQACRDPAVQAACQSIARTLLRQGRKSLLEMGLGLGLGRVAGLPAEELARVKAEQQLLSQRAAEVIPGDPEQPLSCRSVEALKGWVQEVESLGEVEALRRRLQAPQR